MIAKLGNFSELSKLTSVKSRIGDDIFVLFGMFRLSQTLLERYAVDHDPKSGITNDPNDWAREHHKPRYILDLLLSVINVSVQTVDIVNKLPRLKFE